MQPQELQQCACMKVTGVWPREVAHRSQTELGSGVEDASESSSSSATVSRSRPPQELALAWRYCCVELWYVVVCRPQQILCPL
jgi:hypothetical protein